MIMADSFKLVYPPNATEKEKIELKAELEKSINYLSQDKEAQEILQKAINSGVSIRFDTTELNGGYDPSSNEIMWNPTFSPFIINSNPTPGNNSSGYLSPAMVLLHETVHSIDKSGKVFYVDANKPLPTECRQYRCKPTFDDRKLNMRNNREEYATEIESRIAKRLGEPSRYTYMDIPTVNVGSAIKPVSGPMHNKANSSIDSEIQYEKDGKYFSEYSYGHPKDVNGSIYLKKLEIQDKNGKLETQKETEFNEKFKPISEVITNYENGRLISIKTTDYKKETITTENIRYSENGSPIQEKSVTDLNGMPISRVWGNAPTQPQANPKEIDWNKISNKDLYAAILSGDTQSRAALAASFAQSDAGMALKARGAELYAEQQAEQRQQAFQREWEQMQEQAEQRRQQEAEQQQSQSLSRGIRR